MSESQEVLNKMRRFCAYRDRSISEVLEKMRKEKCSEFDEERIISTLEQEGFLNESRYVEGYVRGKFYYNKWGKEKIKRYLCAKGVPNSLISKALGSCILDEDYKMVLKSLIEKKLSLYPIPLEGKIFKKIMDSLYLKGFERDLVLKILEECMLDIS